MAEERTLRDMIFGPDVSPVPGVHPNMVRGQRLMDAIAERVVGTPGSTPTQDARASKRGSSNAAAKNPMTFGPPRRTPGTPEWMRDMEAKSAALLAIGEPKTQTTAGPPRRYPNAPDTRTAGQKIADFFSPARDAATGFMDLNVDMLEAAAAAPTLVSAVSNAIAGNSERADELLGHAGEWWRGEKVPSIAGGSGGKSTKKPALAEAPAGGPLRPGPTLTAARNLNAGGSTEGAQTPEDQFLRAAIETYGQLPLGSFMAAQKEWQPAVGSPKTEDTILGMLVDSATSNARARIAAGADPVATQQQLMVMLATLLDPDAGNVINSMIQLQNEG